MRSVFGRVRPSIVRDHYRKRILQNFFGVWHNLWWEVRQEWRLMVRAECHHKYVLCTRMFLAWRSFVAVQCVKRAKMDLAHYHSNRLVLQRSVTVWKHYCRLRRQKVALRKKAADYYADCITRLAWKQWLFQMAESRCCQEQELRATDIWVYQVKLKCYLLWHQRWRKCQEEKHQLQLAGQLYHSKLLKCMLQAWLDYCAVRRMKRTQNGFAHEVYQDTLKQKTFMWWHQQWVTRRAMAEHWEHVNRLSQRFRVRRLFLHWKYYISLKREKERNEVMASAFYRKHLLNLGLSALRTNILLEKIKMMKVSLARRFHHEKLLNRFWGIWSNRFEERQELKLFPLTCKARQLYRKHSLQRSLAAFVKYCTWRKWRKRQYARADAYFYVKMLPHCLNHMKCFVQMMKTKRENRNKAATFYRENVLVRCFYQWQGAGQASQDHRLMEIMAIVHHDKMLLNRIFSFWRQRTAQVEDNWNKEVGAAHHYCKNLCRNHFVAWWTYIKELKTSRYHTKVAIRCYNRSLLKKSMIFWKEYHNKKKVSNQKRLKAEHHYARKLCQLAWTSWLHYVHKSREICQIADEKYHLKNQITLRWALSVWRNNVAQAIQDRCQAHNAAVYHNRQLLGKVMLTWHEYAAVEAYKKSDRRKVLEWARKTIEKERLKRSFKKWHKARDAALINRLKYQRALVHHRHKLLAETLCAWKKHIRLVYRKILLQKQSMSFLKVKLTSMAFQQWKLQFAAAQVMHEKTELVLWHWSLVLKTKVMLSWFRYTQNRKRKKQRIMDALEQRRFRLLQTGAAQWLRVANVLADWRAKFAAQQQAKHSYDTYRLVQKYALRWRVISSKRKQERGGLPVVLRNQTTGLGPPASSKTSYPCTKFQSQPVSSSSPVRKHFPTQDLAPSYSQRQPEYLDLPKKNRPRPHFPSFLMESLKRQGYYTLFLEGQNNNSKSLFSYESTTGEQVDFKEKAEELSSKQLNEEVDVNLEQEVASDQPDVRAKLFEQSHILPHCTHTNQDQDQRSPFPELRNQAELDVNPSKMSKQNSQMKRLLTPNDFLVPKHLGDSIPKSSTVVRKRHSSNQLSAPMSIPVSAVNATELFCVHADNLVSDQSLQPAHLLSSEHTDKVLFSLDSLQSNSIDTVTYSVDGSTVSTCNQDIPTESMKKEIIIIRNKLRAFEEQKKKIRILKEKHARLQNWLDTAKGKEREAELDFTSAKSKLLKISTEISTLKELIRGKKAENLELVRRAQELLERLSVQ